MSRTFQELKTLVEKWAGERQITQNSFPVAQSKKTTEEVCELIEEASKLDALEFVIDQLDTSIPDHEVFLDELYRDTTKAYKDAIGDVIITLIVGASTRGIDVIECLEMAYEEIKDRKGYLRSDGVFVKEE